MAIPVGRTASQLQAVARWVLVGLIVLGALTWWWPAFRSWGGLAAGVGVVLGFWLCWKTVAADRTVPGHPLHLVVAIPAAILMYHLGRSGFGTGVGEPLALNGSLNVSLVFHLLLLGGTVMLVQSLLGCAPRRELIGSLCGAALMLGPGAAIVWAGAAPVRMSLGLLCLGGAAIWVSPLFAAPPPRRVGGDRPRWASLLRSSRAAVGVFAVVVVAAAVPQAGVAAGVVLFVLLLVAGVVRPQSRGPILAGAVLLAGAAAAALLIVRPQMRLPEVLAGGVPIAALGVGEYAFEAVSGRDAGVVVLGAMVGWVGLLWFGAGLVASAGWLLRSAGAEGPSAGTAIVWAAGAAMVSGALLAPGGLFIPAVTIAMGFVWGMCPAMCGVRQRRRPGAILVVILIGFMAVLGLVRDAGVAGTSTRAFGLHDDFLHGAVGFFLAMSLAWLAGSRKAWAGLLGILAAAMAGGAGELLQAAFSQRTAQWADWRAHLIGSGLVVAPYLLAIGSRWCESPEARAAPPAGQSP